MKKTSLLCLALVLSAAAPADEPAQSEIGAANMVNNASVKVAVLPTYPRRALKNNIGGTVTAEFTISSYGRAVEARITQANPPRVFNNSVLDALKYWSFVPARPVACGTVPQTARQTFRFEPGAEKPVHLLPIEIDGLPTLPRGERMATAEAIRAAEVAEQQLSQVISPRGLVATHRVDPAYPEKALQRRMEGVVSISFLIEKDGSVSDPEVADSVRGSMFRGAALRAIKQWKFEPKYREDGEPVEQVGCHEFIFRYDEYLAAQRRREQLRKQNMQIFQSE